MTKLQAVRGRQATAPGDRYKWIALANTSASMFMATLDGSIVIIALPAIFRGIHLDPLAAGNISYLLWMIMGYRLVLAVLVVTVGRLGDMFGRVRIYNSGFVVFTVASVLLSFDPFEGGRGALWLIGWRLLQAVGGAMLMANSAAILTDAFLRRAHRRERDRQRDVRLAELLLDHGQRPGPAARRGLGHALDLPELRHRDFHRSVLLGHDRRAG
jgi:hypothetical protein